MRSRDREIIKQFAFSALGSAPLVSAKLRAIRQSGVATILNLHRVGPDDGSTYRPLELAHFEALLDFVTSHFTVTTFADLATTEGAERPPLILSFDDGYADFAEFAAPALERHGLKANLNIIPGCIERSLPPLGVIIQDFVGRAPLRALAGLKVDGLPTDPARMTRAELGHALGMFVPTLPIGEQDALTKRLQPVIGAVEGFEPTRMLTLGQIRGLAAHYEIGAHSFDHASMALESDTYLRADLARCAEWFADRLSLPLTIYAFPNGSRRAGQTEVVHNAGVAHVLLVDEDFSSPANYAHPRFTYYARSPAEVRFRATGALRWPKQ